MNSTIQQLPGACAIASRRAWTRQARAGGIAVDIESHAQNQLYYDSEGSGLDIALERGYVGAFPSQVEPKLVARFESWGPHKTSMS